MWLRLRQVQNDEWQQSRLTISGGSTKQKHNENYCKKSSLKWPALLLCLMVLKFSMLYIHFCCKQRHQLSNFFKNVNKCKFKSTVQTMKLLNCGKLKLAKVQVNFVSECAHSEIQSGQICSVAGARNNNMYQ